MAQGALHCKIIYESFINIHLAVPTSQNPDQNS